MSPGPWSSDTSRWSVQHHLPAPALPTEGDPRLSGVDTWQNRTHAASGAVPTHLPSPLPASRAQVHRLSFPSCPMGRDQVSPISGLQLDPTLPGTRLVPSHCSSLLSSFFFVLLCFVFEKNRSGVQVRFPDELLVGEGVCGDGPRRCPEFWDPPVLSA